MQVKQPESDSDSSSERTPTKNEVKPVLKATKDAEQRLVYNSSDPHPKEKSGAIKEMKNEGRPIKMSSIKRNELFELQKKEKKAKIV